MFSDFENENEISEFYKLLKKFNITNKEKIKFTIEYYENKEITNKHESLLTKIGNLIVFILPLLTVLTNNGEIIIKCLISIISIYLIVYMLIRLKNVFVLKYDIAKKENVYAKIKDNYLFEL